MREEVRQELLTVLTQDQLDYAIKLQKECFGDDWKIASDMDWCGAGWISKAFIHADTDMPMKFWGDIVVKLGGWEKAGYESAHEWNASKFFTKEENNG